MMLSMEATSSVLDRTFTQPKQTLHDEPQRASISDKWAMRRWSLRGTADTRSGKTTTRNSLVTMPPPPPPPPATPTAVKESEKEKRKRSRSVDLSPLQSSLKKAPGALTAKLTQYVESMGLREALHRYKAHKKHTNDSDGDDHAFPHNPHHDSKERRVHFPASAPHFKQVYERPATTKEEKRAYHYSRQELMDMVLDAKESLARETRFSSQPEHTVFEQGFLTLPNEKHLFHQKRYYCLLTQRELLCYASPMHAAKRANLKCKIPILKVQECSTMSTQAKIAAFGAHLPATMSVLFFVTRADGERVLLAAESRTMKKSWVHTLQRLTQVREALPACALRQTSTTSTCTSEEDDSLSTSSSEDDEEKQATPETKEEEDKDHTVDNAARCCDCTEPVGNQ